MRRAIGLAVALALLAGCGGSRAATSLPGLTPAKLAKLRALALSVAQNAKDAHPSSVMVFASRRHEANIADGAGSGVVGEDPVYLLVLRGNFVVSFPSAPGPRPPQKATVITDVLTRSTLRELDYGFGDAKNVDTSTLAPGLALSLG